MKRLSLVVCVVPFVLCSCSCLPEKKTAQAPEPAAPITQKAPITPAGVKEVVLLDEIAPHDLAIVKFYATWCPACKSIKQSFEELSKAYAHIPFFAIDVDKANALAEKFGIGSIPTIIVFNKGEAKDKILGFDVDRIKKHLEGTKAQEQEIVVALTGPDHFKTEVLEFNDKPVIVKFYASWCGFCKMVAPLYKELARQYTDKIKFVEIESEKQGELAPTYNVKGFPTFVIFKNGQKVDTIVGANRKALEEALKKLV